MRLRICVVRGGIGGDRIDSDDRLVNSCTDPGAAGRVAFIDVVQVKVERDVSGSHLDV